MSDIIFKTKRLIIRRLSLGNFDDFYNMQSSSKVMDYIKPVINYEEAKAKLA